MFLKHFNFFLSIIFFSFYSKGIEIEIITPKHITLNKINRENLSKYWKSVTKNHKNKEILFDKNNIWLLGGKTEIEEFIQFFQKYDKKTKKIKVDTLVFTSSPEYVQQFGINWSGIYNRLTSIIEQNKNFGFVGLGGRVNDIPTPTKPFVGYESPTQTNPNIEPRTFGNLYVNPRNLAINLFQYYTTQDNPIPETFRVPIVFGGKDLNKERLNAVINNFEREGNIVSNTNSSYIVDENSIAKFSIGRTVPFYTQIIDNTYTNTTSTPTNSQNLSQLYFKNIGINFQVSPKIINLNQIETELIIESIVPKSGNTNTDGSGLFPNPLNFILTKTKNKINLKNNEATFILLVDNIKKDFMQNLMVPYLYKVPVLEKIFKSSISKADYLNTYAMITCTILE